jgi:hypothetical protein
VGNCLPNHAMKTSKQTANTAKSMKVVVKKDSPALAKREEKLHRDLDHDGEKGESAAHRKKVLGAKAAKKGR